MAATTRPRAPASSATGGPAPGSGPDDDGISVDANAIDTLVEDNVARGSDDDGIDVDSASTTIRDNTADGNGDLGIEAVPGVIDGGGNRASGNGNPAQCVNVACTSTSQHERPQEGQGGEPGATPRH